MVFASSQDRPRKRATTGGVRTTASGAQRGLRNGTSDAAAAEAREIVRRAVGDAAGLTVKGQVRRAAQNLGYPADAWRVREAFYNRAGSWSAAALDELRRRFAAWRASATQGPSVLAEHVAAIRRLLVEVERRLAAIEAQL